MLSHENDTERLGEESGGGRRKKLVARWRIKVSRHSRLCLHPWTDGVRRSRSLWTRCETWQRSKRLLFNVSSPPSRGAAESGQEGRANQCVRGGPAAAGRTQHGTPWRREPRLLATVFCCFLLVKQSKILFIWKPARVWRKVWVAYIMKSTFSK